ncbi:hypothetical protein ACHAW6_006438 [Cyclotella cf. meneghiniana]
MASDPAFRRSRPNRPSVKTNPFSGGGGDDDSPNKTAPHPSSAPHDPKLDHYERLLSTEIDPDLFAPPEQFHALSRVIDILGASLQNSKSFSSTSVSSYSDNHAYRSLREQQRHVEEAIEHMAVRHCADLNSSVAAVGRMSRQFDEAAWRVENLRRQVRDVGESLRLGEVQGPGMQPHTNESSNNANPNEPSSQQELNAAAAALNAAAQAGASARSLRELWLKKLECEAILSLLRKLEIIRRAPTGFDALVRPSDGGPCRIAAAVVLLSEALSIMFSDDVAQVQAFDKIMEQLMGRKQRAEEILWATLTDVIYRHSWLEGKEDEKRRRERIERRARAVEAAAREGNGIGTIAEESDEDDTNSYTYTATSYDDDVSTKSGMRESIGSNSNNKDSMSNHTHNNSATVTQFKRMIGRALLETDLDLEGDELRCLEEPAAHLNLHSTATHLPATYLHPEQALPRYTDPVLALRILVDCLTKLKRLDDVEQYLSEGIEREIRRVAEREQAKTYARLERQRGVRPLGEGGADGSGDIANGGNEEDELKEFRLHLNNLLKSFGGVMTRLLHLIQILRHKIASDPILEKMCPSYPVPSSALHSILVRAETAMQHEIKGFLSACLAESDKPKDKRKSRSYNAMNMDQSQLDIERGIFSLGITSSLGGVGGELGWKKATTRANIVELPADQFVSNVLFPRSNTDPEVRHALSFRRSLARWSHEIAEGKRELASCSGQDLTLPNYDSMTEEGALVYIDNIIQRTLLPEMQDEAVNAVIHFLERHDAFDPIVNDVFSRYPNHSVQLEVEMSVACQALYTSTRPIFMALHRLPKGGDMYLSLVTMLEHAMLTFISRMKQRVGDLFHGKAAFSLLEDQRGNLSLLNQAMERRKAFYMLQRVYNDEDDVDDPVTTASQTVRGGIIPLAPSENDTSPKKGQWVGADFKDSFEREVAQIPDIAKFTQPLLFERASLCTDEELMKCACLSNSLLRVASLLEGQLRSRAGGWEKSANINAIRDLDSAIKTIRHHGLRVAKFCRVEVLIQTARRMSEICMSSVLQAEDAVRLPTCVNNLGEYLATSSDCIREAGGNAIAAYSFSSLEQYIPTFLMQTARIMADSSAKPITLNGIESLDRTGSVLYRDLKGATSFENSFWNEEAAAHAFEQSAVFISLMEISQKDLEDHYRLHPSQFTDQDYELMFGFNGPRRRGDSRRFNLLKSKMKTERKPYELTK